MYSMTVTSGLAVPRESLISVLFLGSNRELSGLKLTRDSIFLKWKRKMRCSTIGFHIRIKGTRTQCAATYAKLHIQLRLLYLATESFMRAFKKYGQP